MPRNLPLDNPETVDDQATAAPSTPKWEKRDDLKPIVSELIEMFPEKLSHVRPSSIGYVSFSRKRSKTQAKIYGMRPMFGLFSNVDYILSVHLENWVMLELSEKYLLILHELLHVPPGGFDESSKQYRRCVDHDIKDFSYLLESYGIHWENAGKILKTRGAHEKEKVAASE